MPNTVELDIKRLPPTPNQTRGQHWAKAKKIRDEIGLEVHYVWASVKPKDGSHIGKRATLDAVIHAHGPAADSDNQIARLKPVIDGLVEAGALVDDAPRWLTLGTITHQKAKPRHGHITITITYQEPAA